MALLDLSALREALAALERSLAYLDSTLAEDPGLREQFRAAAIQGFEFTYEVSFKMIKRQLQELSSTPSEIDQRSFNQVMRAAFEAGLVPDFGRFSDYREKRNVTSHTYDQDKAEEILGVIRDFAQDTKFLLAELERRNHVGD